MKIEKSDLPEKIGGYKLMQFMSRELDGNTLFFAGYGSENPDPNDPYPAYGIQANGGFAGQQLFFATYGVVVSSVGPFASLNEALERLEALINQN